MIIPGILCACGADDIAALAPGADAIHEHPHDMFGLPDLRQTPVVSVPGIPMVARCLACLMARFPALVAKGAE